MHDPEANSQEVARFGIQHEKPRAELRALHQRWREAISRLESDPTAMNSSMREIITEIALVVDRLMDVSEQLKQRNAQPDNLQEQPATGDTSDIICRTEEILGQRFFMPDVTDEDLEESFQSLRRHLTRTTSLVVSDRRISCIEYIDDRRIQKVAQVGKKLPMRRGGRVVAILDASLLYFICTSGRGIGGGKPITVYAAKVSRVQYFGGQNSDRSKLN